ncbi:MAG: DUF3147 family protein [Candidatus Acidiferrales bacterium]
MLKELIVRFLVGGATVRIFAMIGDLFKPKSFAGLFGAAPSIALATLGLTIVKEGPHYAAIEGKSMAAGAAAFFVFASLLSCLLMRTRWPVLRAASVSMVVWFVVAFGLWFAILR